MMITNRKNTQSVLAVIQTAGKNLVISFWLALLLSNTSHAEQITLTDATGEPAQMVTLKFIINENSILPEAILSLQTQLNYQTETAVLTFIAARPGNAFPNGTIAPLLIVNDTAGIIDIALAAALPAQLSNGAELLELDFQIQPDSPAGESRIQIVNADFDEGSYQYQRIDEPDSPTDGKIIITVPLDPYNCGSANVLITEHTYSSTADENCTATTQLTAGPGVLISSGAIVNYQAPMIVLKPGFRIATGATFTATTQTIVGKNIITQIAKSTEADAVVAKLAITDDAEIKTVEETEINIDTEALVTELIGEMLATLQNLANNQTAITLTPDQLQSVSIDQQAGNWIVFATDKALLVQDTNRHSDIYRYETHSETLQLISQTAENTSGSDNSTYPVTDQSGQIIAFQSEAKDLTEHDTNLASDIYWFNNEQQTLSRISHTANELNTPLYTQPEIDRQGRYMLYVQEDEHTRTLLGYELSSKTEHTLITGYQQEWQPKELELSDEGRYLAYILRHVSGNASELCQIYWHDLDTEKQEKTDCGHYPDIAKEGYFHFDAEGNLGWVVE